MSTTATTGDKRWTSSDDMHSHEDLRPRGAKTIGTYTIHHLYNLHEIRKTLCLNAHENKDKFLSICLRIILLYL